MPPIAPNFILPGITSPTLDGPMINRFFSLAIFPISSVFFRQIFREDDYRAGLRAVIATGVLDKARRPEDTLINKFIFSFMSVGIRLTFA